MLYFNPAYTHKADQLALKLQLELVEPLNANGGDRRSEEFQIDNIKLKNNGGTSQEYLLSRLKRDNPEIVSRIEAGEFKSVRQAALAAGISWNLKRRHLDESQRARVASKLANMNVGAKEGNQFASNNENKCANLHNSFESQQISVAEAAKMLNVSTRLVSHASKVEKSGIPELNDLVDAKEAKVSIAHESHIKRDWIAKK